MYDKISEEYSDSRIILTGHSLGGSIAQIVGAIRGAEAVTFNAYGTKDMFKNLYDLSDKEFRKIIRDLI